jgi:hypothetical protein
MAATPRQQAQDFVGNLRAQTQAFCDGTLDEEQLRRAQRKTMDEIRATNTEAEVARVFLQSLPVYPEDR